MSHYSRRSCLEGREITYGGSNFSTPRRGKIYDIYREEMCAHMLFCAPALLFSLFLFAREREESVQVISGVADFLLKFKRKLRNCSLMNLRAGRVI